MPGLAPLPVATALATLGWTATLAAEIGADEQALTPARLALLHRDRIEALTATGPATLICPPKLPVSALAVGDWVLCDGTRVVRALPRHSLLQRRAAGTGTESQLMAANVDTMFVLSSCNADFNAARLERFLVLAHAARIMPVVVLTKADLADPAPFVATARALSQDLTVLALDAREPAAAQGLQRWCGPGQTVVLLGSSGVGKSSLANALAQSGQSTGGIREDDAKGRHTTTSRALLPLPGGGWLIDTPGLREIQLSEVAEGIDLLFADLAARATECRFRDCRHQSEPGCAVQAAIAAGEIDPARLSRWLKLVAEEEANAAAMAKSRQRAAGKFTRKSASKHRPG